MEYPTEDEMEREYKMKDRIDAWLSPEKYQAALKAINNYWAVGDKIDGAFADPASELRVIIYRQAMIR